MIKELSGLKCRALAVDVPEKAFNLVYDVAYESLWYSIGEPEVFEKTRFRTDYLPEGNWQILGRANEISNDIDALEKIYGHPETADFDNFHKWQSYCIANSISNQLILINEI